MLSNTFCADFSAMRSRPARASTSRRYRSAGLFTRSRSTSWSTSFSPRPSISMARRAAKCSKVCLRCALQYSPPVQRVAASPGTRTTGEPHLPIEPVHLVDHAIDGVRKPVARLSHLPVIAEQPFGALHQLALLRYAKPELDEPRKRLRLPAPARLRGAADGIGEEPERPRRGHARIELAHRAGGGVARVDVLLFSQLALARVEGVEVAAVHRDLAAHLELARVRGLRQAQRDRAQRTQVGGDVLACSAVAARGSLGEQAVAVGQADRQAVELRLRRILHCIDFERLAHAPVEGAHRFLVESVGDGQHRRAVPDLGELGQRRPAHPLRGRVRGRQFGMLRFQSKKLLKQPVVFSVIDLRLVLDVVEPVMVLEGFPESFASLPDISRHAHENSRSASGLPGSMPRSASMCRTASTSVPMAASARSSTGLPLSSTRRAPCAAASWRALRAIAWKLRAGSGVRTTSSVRVMPSSRGVTWKACSPASISVIAAPTTCSATWMSAWAHTRSRLRAASSAWRISGAETLAPTFAASVSTSERNSSSSLSLATPARVTNCNAALQPPPFEAASKTRFAKRCSSGAHSSSRLAAAIPRGAARSMT